MLIHARFSPEVKEFAIALIQGLKQSRYIVCRETATREHYHAVFESPIGIEAIKKRFQAQCKSLGLVSKKGQENAYYGGVKECTDPSYVCKDGDIVISAGYTTEELEALRAEGDTKYNTHKRLIVAQSLNVQQVEVVKRKSESMRAKFVRYLKDEIGWVVGDHIHLDDSYDTLCDSLIDLCTEFWENAFTTPQGTVCVEYARWMFADDDVKDKLRAHNRCAIKKMLR